MKSLQEYLNESLKPSDIPSKVTKAMGSNKKVWIPIISRYANIEPDEDFPYSVEKSEAADKWVKLINAVNKSKLNMETIQMYFEETVDMNDGFESFWNDDDFDGLVKDIETFAEYM